jgi:hypothetical protein
MGIAMLSAVLKSEIAVRVSIEIIQALLKYEKTIKISSESPKE